jgi:hypothetical protein
MGAGHFLPQIESQELLVLCYFMGGGGPVLIKLQSKKFLDSVVCGGKASAEKSKKFLDSVVSKTCDLRGGPVKKKQPVPEHIDTLSLRTRLFVYNFHATHLAG